MRRILLSLQEAQQVSQRDGDQRCKRGQQSGTHPRYRSADASSNGQRALVQAQQKMKETQS